MKKLGFGKVSREQRRVLQKLRWKSLKAAKRRLLDPLIEGLSTRVERRKRHMISQWRSFRRVYKNNYPDRRVEVQRADKVFAWDELRRRGYKRPKHLLGKNGGLVSRKAGGAYR